MKIKNFKCYLGVFLVGSSMTLCGCSEDADCYAILVDDGGYKLVKCKSSIIEMYVNHKVYVYDAVSDKKLGVVGDFSGEDMHQCIGFQQLVYLVDMMSEDEVMEKIHFFEENSDSRNDYLDENIKYNVKFMDKFHLKYYTLYDLLDNSVNYAIGYDLVDNSNNIGIFDINTSNNYYSDMYKISSEDVNVDKESLSREECSLLLDEYRCLKTSDSKKLVK